MSKNIDIESQKIYDKQSQQTEEDGKHQEEIVIDEGEEDEEDLLKIIDAKLPKVQCDRGYKHSIITKVCTVKTCGKRLLCDKCLETDHLPLKKYAKKFSEFLKMKSEKKVVKEKNVVDIEYFLQEKDQFLQKLDFSYKIAVETAEKEFDILQQSVIDIIQQSKQIVLDFKLTHYTQSKNLLDSLQPQLDDIYFKVEDEMAKLLQTTDFESMDKIIKKVVEYPDQKKIENLANDFRLISHHIREFESESSLLVLKHVSPIIESHLTEQLQKLASEVDARRILLEDNVSNIEQKDTIWNPQGVINYRTISRNVSDPILCACEVGANKIVFGTGAPGNNVLVYDKLTHQFIDEFQAHESSVMAVIHYHDTIILTAGSDGIVKFWDITDCENFKTFQAHNETLMTLHKVSIRSFASAAFDNTIKIWNFESGSQSPEGTLVGHTEGIFQLLMLSEEEQIMASSAADYNVKIWNLGRLECVGTLKGHKNQVNALEKLGEDQIISGGDDNMIMIWNWRTLNRVGRIESIPFAIWNLRLMNDFKSLVVVGEDLSIVIVNMETNLPVSKLFGHKSFPRSLIQLKSGTLLTFGYDAIIKFWRSKNDN